VIHFYDFTTKVKYRALKPYTSLGLVYTFYAFHQTLPWSTRPWLIFPLIFKDVEYTFDFLWKPLRIDCNMSFPFLIIPSVFKGRRITQCFFDLPD